MTDASKPPNFESNSSNRENYISIRDYFERRLYDMERSTAAALHNSETAIKKAEEATNYRLALLNESRDALRDQTRLYVTKPEFDALRESYQAEIKSMQKIMNIGLGALATVQVLIGLALAIARLWV